MLYPLSHITLTPYCRLYKSAWSRGRARDRSLRPYPQQKCAKDSGAVDMEGTES